MADCSNISENNLIKKTLLGDKDAFAQLVNIYKKRVYNLVYQVLKNHHDSEDLAQEVFIHIYKKLDTFQEKSKFSTWLYRVTYNMSINRLKKVRREIISLNEDSINNDSGLIAEMTTPKETYTIKERQEYLHRLVDSLPAKYRTVITLRYLEDLSYEEIADMLDFPVGTVKTHLYRAKKFLKDKLKQTRRENEHNM